MVLRPSDEPHPAVRKWPKASLQEENEMARKMVMEAALEQPPAAYIILQKDLALPAWAAYTGKHQNMQAYLYGPRIRAISEKSWFFCKGTKKWIKTELAYFGVSYDGMYIPEHNAAITGSDFKAGTTLWMGNYTSVSSFKNFNDLKRRLQRMIDQAPEETFIVDCAYDGEWTERELSSEMKSSMVYAIREGNHMYINLMTSLFYTIEIDAKMRVEMWPTKFRLRASCLELVLTERADEATMTRFPRLSEEEKLLMHPRKHDVLFRNMPQFSEQDMATWRKEPTHMAKLGLIVRKRWNGVKQTPYEGHTMEKLVVFYVPPYSCENDDKEPPALQMDAFQVITPNEPLTVTSLTTWHFSPTWVRPSCKSVLTPLGRFAADLDTEDAAHAYDDA